MPDELKLQVQAAADKNGRSMHAELLQRIQSSFAAASSHESERVANQRAYELANARTLIGILALLCSANGDLLGILADAVETPGGVPEGLIEAARKQAAKAKALPDAMGYDPVKEMAEVRRLLPPLLDAQADDLPLQTNA